MSRRTILVASLFSAATAQAQEPIVRANLSSTGAEATRHSYATPLRQVISADGRFVVFTSADTNLVPNDTNGFDDVFVRDLVAGTTIRVSVATGGAEGNGESTEASLTSDGRFVVFTSEADQLVANDTNGTWDIFVHDRDPDGNGLFDESNATTERVDVASDGTEANNGSTVPSISDNGDKIAFRSSSTNLIANDKNGKADIFVHVRSTGLTARVSKATSGVAADGDSDQPQISGDGSAVVFRSIATNLAGIDGNGDWDIFVRDLVNSVTERVSTDANGVNANHASDTPTITSDGRYVCFRSPATNLFPENDPNGNSQDVFVKDRLTGAVDCMTIDSQGFAGRDGNGGSISPDGTKVAFYSGYPLFVPVDTNAASDVFVRDVATKAIVCASVNCMGIPAAGGSDDGIGLSSDGRYVVFDSLSSELVSGDTNNAYDVFVNDLTNPGFQAYWANYGAGWPGTKGIPSFTASGDPEFGATIDLQVANSWGKWQVGFLLIGFGETNVPTGLGGSILVDLLYYETEVIPPSGWIEPTAIPYDPALCGLEADLQMLEVDPGVSKGFSFTPGLALLFGR